jgi:hypothetical protein
MNMPTAIYQPTAEQVATLLDSLPSRWPQLAHRIAAARQLLLEGQLDYRPRSAYGLAAAHSAWFCGPLERVDEKAGCGCLVHHTLPDANSPLLMGRLYCEHLIAWHTYKRIAQQLLCPAVSAGRLLVRSDGMLFAHTEPQRMPCVVVTPTPDLQLPYTFASPDDLGRFAVWLARQPRALQDLPAVA